VKTNHSGDAPQTPLFFGGNAENSEEITTILKPKMKYNPDIKVFEFIQIELFLSETGIHDGKPCLKTYEREVWS